MPINRFFQNGFALFLLSAAIVVIIAPLMQNGVFMDAMLYKTVAHNYATGNSGFWRMKFTDVAMNHFYEQPPLFFYLTGTWYKLFGESLFADRAFTMLWLIITVYLIRLICRRMFAAQLVPSVFFLLLCIPVLHWTFVNQAIETVVTPLSLAGFLLAVQPSRSTSNAAFKGTCLGILLTLLFLTKGFQSCFIVVSPFIYYWLQKKKHTLVTGLTAIAVLTVALYILLFIYEPSCDWFNAYTDKRLKATLMGVGATTSYRAEIIVRIVTELILPLIITAGAYLGFRKTAQIPVNGQYRQKAWLFLLTGICGTFPYAITLEQRGFYLVPGIPFLVFALIAFAWQPLSRLQEMATAFCARRGPRAVIMGLLLGSLIYLVYSPCLYKREEVMMTDLGKMKPFLQPGDTISIDEEMWNYTSVHAVIYMQNHTNLSDRTLHDYYLHDDGHQTAIKPGYTKVPLGTQKIHLYRRVE
jgi:4-amino-4-deoxy-L-arabinose transferase-like glycosyltransferase